jgi:hypothetical protein
MGNSMTAAVFTLDPEGAQSSADELGPGTKLFLGQYVIEKFVNSGGFGIVYLAWNSLERQVIIKECFPSSYCRRIGTMVGARSRAQQDDFRSAVGQFMQEAVTLSKLSHPNIVKVHQVFEDNDTAYMAMDYVDGPDLLQTVEGSAPALRPDQIVTFLLRMLDAVGYVHAQGLLHRDVSPDNMLVDLATGNPVLIDFGASRKDVTRKTRAVSGLRVVKDGYSPQEFYVSGSKHGPFSDLYALAASFYHLISGEPPKTSRERLSAIAGREGDPLRPLAGRFAAYPDAFLRAIDKAMSVFPRDRFQSADEWFAMLQPEVTAVAVIEPQPVAVAVESPAPVAVDGPVEEPAIVSDIVVADEPAGDDSFADDALAPLAPADVEAAAAPVSPPPVAKPAGRGARDLLISSTAAVLLLAGLLSLPGMDPSQSAAAAPGESDGMAVTSLLRLPGGLAFEEVSTATGSKIVVADLPVGASTTLQQGDALLVYSATGETIGTAAVLREILRREMASGVTTYGFVILRGDSTIDVEFQLGVAG